MVSTTSSFSRKSCLSKSSFRKIPCKEDVRKQIKDIDLSQRDVQITGDNDGPVQLPSSEETRSVIKSKISKNSDKKRPGRPKKVQLQIDFTTDKQKLAKPANFQHKPLPKSVAKPTSKTKLTKTQKFELKKSKQSIDPNNPDSIYNIKSIVGHNPKRASCHEKVKKYLIHWEGYNEASDHREGR